MEKCILHRIEGTFAISSFFHRPTLAIAYMFKKPGNYPDLYMPLSTLSPGLSASNLFDPGLTARPDLSHVFFLPVLVSFYCVENPSNEREYPI